MPSQTIAPRPRRRRWRESAPTPIQLSRAQGSLESLPSRVCSPKYFKLWKAITENLEPGERLPGKSKRPKPEVVYREAEGALQQIASQWKERIEQMQAATPGQEHMP